MQEEVRGAAGGARPPQGPPSTGGHPGVRVQQRFGLHLAGAGKEGGAHLQENHAEGVVRHQGHGVHREWQAEEDHWHQDQRDDAVD